MSNASTRYIPWTIFSPYRNDSHALQNLDAPAWVDSPSVRGTADILRSCLLTLLACVYTSLHLNVPDDTNWRHVLWSKVRWMLLALFLPEFVLFMAGDQLRQAWNLRKELRKLQLECEDGAVKKDVGKLFKTSWRHRADEVEVPVRLRLAVLFLCGYGRRSSLRRRNHLSRRFERKMAGSFRKCPEASDGATRPPGTTTTGEERTLVLLFT